MSSRDDLQKNRFTFLRIVNFILVYTARACLRIVRDTYRIYGLNLKSFIGNQSLIYLSNLTVRGISLNVLRVDI